MNGRDTVVRHLGRVDYAPTWQAMRDFTACRDAATPDELWLLEHPPVFTQGQAGKAEHLIAPTAIPVVPIDRGGQITYHGPGQLVAYVLVDLRRRGYGIRELVAHRNFKRPLACLWPLESPTDAWVAGRYRPGWLGTDGCDIVLS